MRTYVFFLFIFMEFLSVFVDARQAPSFAQLEGSINGKIGSFKTNCTGKLDNFGTSVNGKLDAWNSNYRQAQQNFQNSVNSKCDALSSNISNKLASLQSSMDSKFDSAGFSAFKNDANNAFKNLASEIGQAKNAFKTFLQSDLGAGYSNISSDFDTLNTDLQTEASDISNDFEEGGELSDAVDAVEDNYTPANVSPITMSNWGPLNEYGQHVMTLSAGHTYQLLGSSNTYCYVHAERSSDGVTVCPYNQIYGGATFTISSPPYSSCRIVVCGSDVGSYSVVMVDPGLGDLDTDGDGFSDQQEQNAGTDPNNAADAPGNAGTGSGTVEPDTKADVGGAKTGISALDEIIAKLSPDFSAFSSPGTEDFSLSIPIEIGSFSQTFQIGPFDSLLDGKLTWMRTTIRLFITAIMAFVLVRNLIKVLKEW